MEKPKIIVFDLNKTLIRENSWQVLNKAMGVTEDEDMMLMGWSREGIISDAQGQEIICSIYQKRANPTRESILEILNRYTYRDGAEQTIQSLTKKGYQLALLSGSMDILVKHVANELGIKTWACNNRFIFDETGMLENIETVDNDDSYKLNQLVKMCNDLGIEPSEVMSVGDGDSDVLLFEKTGCGVTFSDSKVKDKAKYTIASLQDLLSLVA